MSTGVWGPMGSVAAGQLQQARAADADRSIQEATRHQRTESANQRAENAAGMGEMEQDQAASDRDADGRRLWDKPARSGTDDTPDGPETPVSRDPTGAAGTRLDLSG